MKRPVWLTATMVAAAVISLGNAPTRAETLTTALSEPTVSITSNFTGAEIVVFGVVERDAVTVARPDPYDIVVAIKGPTETVVTRRKDRVFGVWVNRTSTRFAGIPSFYALHTTRALTEIADPALLVRLGIGANHLELRPIDAATDPQPNLREFRDALLRLKLQQGLFAERVGAVEFLSPSLFRTTIPLPADVPDGEYSAEVTLFRGGVVLASQQQQLSIGKAGFEQLTYSLAQDRSVLYGLATVLMALLTGWLAGVIFRRE